MKNRLIRFFGSRNFKNVAWNLVNTIGYPLFVLAATPFFIHRLGTEQYGIWMLINTTTQLMSILNLGLGDTAIKYISNHKALGEEHKIRETTSAIMGVGLCVFILAILLGAGLFILMQHSDFFPVSPDFKSLAAKSAFLAFLLFGLKFLEQIVLSVFQGYERYDLASVFSLASRLTILAGNVVFVYYDFSLLEVFSSSSVLLALFLLLEMGYAKRRFPAIQLWPSYKRKPLQVIFSFGIWSWIQSLLAIVTTQTDKFIVAWFSGMTMLTYYSLGSVLTTQVHGVFTSASAWVFPAVSARSARKESLLLFYRKADVSLASFGFASIIAFLVIEKPLLGFWLGEEIYRQAIPFIRVFLYYNLFLLINVLPYYFLNGSGHVRENTLSELITKSLNVGGMVVGYLAFGSVGLIWGLVFSMLLATPIRISMLRRYALHIKNPAFGLDVLICPSLIVLFFQNDAVYLKVVFAVIFLFTFYLMYVRTFLTGLTMEKS